MSKKTMLLLFFLVIPFVLGETYHVRVDGNNSLDGLSYETSWKSIAYSLENSNENSEIIIYEGEYFEDSQWGGYLHINQEKENRTFKGIGEVIMKVGPDVNRMILFVGPELTIFEGFIFDGQNSAVLGMDSAYGNKVFRNNQFINFLNYGISLKGGENNVVENNTFGYGNLHMNFSPIILTNLRNSEIKNNYFFSGKESLIYAFNASNSSIKNNIFGSEENPLFLDTYAMFVRVMDSDNFVIENNELYIGDGHGVNVYSNTKGVENPKLINNSFFIYHALNRYGIAVGSESEQEFDLIGANISGNKLYMPAEETYKHNLFVGFTKNSIISGNYLDGGGYGLALKGNNDALIFGNEVYNATTVAIVDNSGWNNKIFDNIVNCNYDRCMRIDNTESAGRPLYNSSWYNNTLYIPLDQFAIYIGGSVDVIGSGSLFFDNTYYQGEHEQIICTKNASYFTFFDLRTEFGWGENSDLFAFGEVPEIRNISVYGIQPTSVRIKFNTSESSTTILRYGEEDLDIEMNSTLYGMEHNYVLSRLAPKTRYNYQITVCDNGENCVDSDILSFRTKKGGGIKLHFISDTFGDDFWN
ncbi:hypothetical protein HOG16_04305 [Candidatus Woesearchaeota archaeon]|nr:hypothetical protein [Candidatus Woesearchaeota archaeon]MBT4322242.1 hypothetical protein [Candidatus Woesearchaeota archaeon]MBT4631262.1 hypothetical protein [Candidatus Woesearchaeota archaeon]